MSTIQALEDLLIEVREWQEKLYKDLHANPELSFNETRTAGIAAAKLEGPRAGLLRRRFLPSRGVDRLREWRRLAIGWL